MATSKSLEFLPDYLKTDYNKRFLSSTLDQLISEPRTQKFNGFVGRQFAPVYRNEDSYIVEDNSQRQNYQLEPSVVVKNKNQQVDFFASYPDLLQKINYYGGIVTDHTRLFTGQDYRYNGHFDLDKLVNFSQYYWLPNGPAAVNVGFGVVPIEQNYTLFLSNGVYSSDIDFVNNEIIVRRGGTYTFTVNHPGSNFWIQSEPSKTGYSATNLNQIVRLSAANGVVNNGSSIGMVTFTVPNRLEQNSFQSMPFGVNVELATNLNYSQIQHQKYSDFVAANGYIDNYSSDLTNKFLIFVDQGAAGDTEWTSSSITGYPGSTVPPEQRAAIYRITFVQIASEDYIRLELVNSLVDNTRVTVLEGDAYSGLTFYTASNNFVAFPLITADVDFLYFQNSGSDSYIRIRVIDAGITTIDVDGEIIGAKNYTSPNGVVFSNGLKVSFDSSYVPSTYTNNEFYVEGVGQAIRLVPVTGLYQEWQSNTAYTVDQLFVYQNALYRVLINFTSGTEFEEPGVGEGSNYELYDNIDYITINRASKDLNDWSDSNRWFHQDIIGQTASYNNSSPLYNQNYRARRPIIEFDPDLQLYNFGREYVQDVDFYDNVFTDAFGGTPISVNDFVYSFAGTSDGSYNDGEFILGRTYEITNLGTTTQDAWNIIAGTVSQTYTVGDKFVAKTAGTGSGNGTADLLFELQSVALVSGQTIIFGNDADQETRKTIFEISIVELDGNDTILLTPVTVLEDFQNVRILKGQYSGKNFHNENNQWYESQQKTLLNQAPLFDIIDVNSNSLGNENTYQGTTFRGTKIFSYKIGSGSNDIVLGFPLSYKNIGNIGDIEFENHYENDVFGYSINDILSNQAVNSGFIVKNITRTQRQKLNVWQKTQQKSKQYQQFTQVVDGTQNQFKFNIPVVEFDTNISSVKIYVDNVLLNFDQFSYIIENNSTRIILNAAPVAGSKLDFLLYSNKVSNSGFFQIPGNFENNPLNQKFQTLTLGQLRSHTREIFSSLKNLSGIELGSNNTRDIDYRKVSGTIVQHSASAIYPALFLTNDKASFVDSVYYAQKEYSRFKNRFLEIAKSINYYSTAKNALHVDEIIQKINQAKSTDSPWYYSDMVPYGQARSVLTYEVLDVDLINYQIETIFNDTVASNRAVLVYYNDQLLVKNLDYVFPQNIPAVQFTDSFNRQLGDIIKIVDYSSTDGNYIPETPTKLGIYPKFEPKIFVDDRYSDARSVIQGHDGSITPAFGDYRDSLLLELEKRIYNNIKTTYDVQYQSLLWDMLPGKFRTTDYSKTEFDQILGKSFLRWVGSNQLNYISNTTFNSNNTKTWNFKKSRSILDDEELPGHWRGIYRYFYDTDRPHTDPWEMLGFSEKPTWWDSEYGLAPYTRGNLTLWQDLEQGQIKQGTRAGIDTRFARPGLTRIIPVDDYGDLLTPDQFLLRSFNGSAVSASWVVGDMGPVETAWRNSSDYAFACQIALALSRPAEYFSLTADSQRYAYDQDLEQFFYQDTKNRISPQEIILNGIDETNQVSRSAGCINWIVDYLNSQGIQGYQYVRTLLDNLDIQLAYRLAGFTDKKLIKIYAEQASPGSSNDTVLVPSENFQLYLHKSTPVRRAVYSSVIIRKTGTGYSVEGYDFNNPYFTIIPSISTGEFTTIKGIEKSARIYKQYQLVFLTIPYGYEFQNRQQVVDFLVSYQRYLNSLGFTFNEYNEDLSRQQDWILSAQEFLIWSEQGWGESSLIVLSPAVGTITLNETAATVDEINGSWSGSRLIDQNFTAIKTSNFNLLRDSDMFKIETINDRIIGLADLSLVQFEHIVIFDNFTVFNDVIYDPNLGDRQFRLKLVGTKTALWNGRLDAPGFFYYNGEIPEWTANTDYYRSDLVQWKNRVYSANEFIPAATSFDFAKWTLNTTADTEPSLYINFAGGARKFVNIYDIDADYYDVDLEFYSNNLIGFKNRDYLDALGVDTKTQVKFYQGFVKEKGTQRSVNALTSARFNKLGGELTYDEEWAVRVGTYGAVKNQQITEFVVEETSGTANPFGIELLNENESATAKLFRSYTTDSLYRQDENFNGTLFTYRSNASVNFEQDITSAGFVDPNTVDISIFDINNIGDQASELLANMRIGYTIYTAKDYTGNWNVYKATGTDLLISSIGYGLDSTAELTFKNYHNLTPGQVLILKDFDTSLDGVYQVLYVDSLNSVTAAVDSAKKAYLESVGVVESSGMVFQLVSVKFPRLTNINARTDWLTNDQVWVDYPDQWSVYKKTEPWAWAADFESIETNTAWGTSLHVSDDQLITVVGVPKATLPYIEYYNIGNRENPYRRILSSPKAANDQFGTDVYQVGKRLYASAPAYSSNRGYVAVYNLVGQIYYLDQIILGTAMSTGKFGSSIAASQDQRWLFASAPNDNLVKTFKRIDVDRQTLTVKPASVTGSISGTVMTATTVVSGTLVIGDVISGSGVSGGTTLVNQLTATNTATLVATGSSVTGNPVLTFAGTVDLSNVTPGQIVSGSGIPVNTTVLSKLGNTVTMSNNASPGGVFNFTFREPGFEGTYTVSINQTVPAGTTITVIEDTYSLAWTADPGQTAAIRIIDGTNGQLLEETTDYTINSVGGTNNQVVFAVPSTKNYTIYKDSYYTLVNTISNPGSSNFGYKIRSSGDGRQLFISALGENSNSGKIYIYDRAVEAFDSNSGSTDFTTVRSLTYASGVPLYDVRVNGVVKTYTTEFTNPAGNLVRFANPLAFRDRVEIETSQWILAQSIVSGDPQQQSKFGFDIDFGGDNTTLAVAQTYYRTDDYRSGLVHVYQNRSRINGSILGNSDAATVTIGHSIRINDYEVVFTGTTLDSVVSDINNKKILAVTAKKTQVTEATTVDQLIVGKSYTITFVGNTDWTAVGAVGTSGETFTATSAGTGTGLAETVNVYLEINSDGKITTNALRVAPGQGTALSDLGLVLFTLNTRLTKPKNDVQEFGYAVRLNSTATSLIVSSLGADNLRPTGFEQGATTFDLQSTKFVDLKSDSGSVFVYDRLSDPDNQQTYVLAQTLRPDLIDSDENFGKNIDVVSNLVVCLSKKTAQAGKVNLFDNVGSLSSWNTVTTQNAIVDLDSIKSISLYNKRTNSIIAYLDYIDPARGRVLGAAEQNIDYKTAFDPAVYNMQSGQSADTDYFWSSHQVGRVWWDLDTLRYVDYQQQDRIYRLENWGRLFAGSTVKLYEWVESPVKPSEYVNRGLLGIPKHANDSFYTELIKVDPQTGILRSSFYFWVSDKESSITGRNTNLVSLTSIITQPTVQGIPYAAVLDNNSLALYNCSQFLSGDEIVLRVETNALAKDLPVHNEWQLIKENPNENIPEFLINKLVDSLVGSARIGNQIKEVPDSRLPVNQRYGISIRPRQSMFVDRLAASKIFVQYLNRELATQIIVGNKNIDGLYAKEDYNTSGETWDLEFATYEDFETVDQTALLPGTKILIISNSQFNGNWTIYTWDGQGFSNVRQQEYNLENYWNFIDWYEPGYDIRTIPDYTVSDFVSIPATGIANGQLIKVNNTGNGSWGIYKKTAAGLDPVALQNATIEINNLLYNPESAGIGYDVVSFDNIGFDYNPTDNFRMLISALRNDILIDDLRSIFVGSVFALFEYIFYEQKQPDWLFKTSFISILHKLRSLDQYPSYVRDNQDYYKSYIEEVKPYKTKIREYILGFDKLDVADFGATTDFDFPVYFDTESGTYQLPDYTQNLAILDQPPYVYWMNNYTFGIDSVSVLNGGLFYQQEPTLVINGGDGTARLKANIANGQIVSVTVLNPGNGFIQTPTITVIAVDGGTGAELLVRLGNQKIRTMSTTVKFDRIEYSGIIANWTANTGYQNNEFFVNNNQIYLVVSDHTSGVSFGPTVSTALVTAITSDAESAVSGGIQLVSATSFATTGYVQINSEVFAYTGKSGNTLTGVTRAVFDTTAQTHAVSTTVRRVDYRVAKPGDLNSAMKRTQYYYAPLSGMTPNDLKRLFAGVDYPGVRVQGIGDFYGPQVSVYDIEQQGQGQTAETAVVVGSIAGTTLTVTNVLRGSLADGQYLSGEGIVEGTRIILTEFDGSITGSVLTVNRMVRGQVRVGQQLVGPGIGFILTVTSFGTGTGGVGTYNLSNTDNVPLGRLKLQGTGFGQTGTYTVDRSQTVASTTIQATLPDVTDIDVFYRSAFLDTSLGLRPEDINVEGGRFVDTANSHAPEELVPGRIYDTLEMRVFTTTPTPFPIGFRIFHTMNCNTVDSNLNPQPTVQLVGAMTDSSTSCEVILHDQWALLLPTVGYSPTIVINGEYMTYTNFDPATNIISGITRAVTGGVAAREHAVGSFVTVLDNLKDQRFYYRISGEATTTLAQDLAYNDTEISVVDATNLYQPYAPDNTPGVVFINGERIVYWNINYSTNKLSQLVRGTQGTGIAQLHTAGSLVSDASASQLIEDGDPAIWLNAGVGTAADGNGLYQATTVQGDFLRQKLSYVPS